MKSSHTADFNSTFLWTFNYVRDSNRAAGEEGGGQRQFQIIWICVCLCNALITVELHAPPVKALHFIDSVCVPYDFHNKQQLFPYKALTDVFLKGHKLCSLWGTNWILYFKRARYAEAQLVEVLRYKSEGRGFDSRWCHWNFSLT